MQSIVQTVGTVQFPQHTGERIYMLPFTLKDGLPEEAKRWQPTVDAMLRSVDTDQPIYLMVDQGVVQPGKSHRRPGIHIDGYWIPNIQAHGGGGHGSTPSKAPDRGGHGSIQAGGGHRTHITNLKGMWDDQPGWNMSNASLYPEGIILASDVSACRALIGSWDGEIGEGGDCSHLDLSHLDEIKFAANIAYAGNVTMLHESLPIEYECKRTVVRLNVPGWSPKH